MLTNKKILITNDDGINGPGLKALVEEVNKYTSDILILCPEHQMSAVSQARTFGRGLSFKKVSSLYNNIPTYTLDGTPADCVRFASVVLNYKPEYVISGANNGLNQGDDILYSGTIGACFEANFCGFKALAVSVNFDDFDSVKVLSKALDFIVDNKLDIYNILNINLRKDYKGIKFTEQGRFCFDTIYRLGDDGLYYCEGDPIMEFEGEKDNADAKNFYAGYITISPLTTDRTDRK